LILETAVVWNAAASASVHVIVDVWDPPRAYAGSATVARDDFIVAPPDLSAVGTR